MNLKKQSELYTCTNRAAADGDWEHNTRLQLMDDFYSTVQCMTSAIYCMIVECIFIWVQDLSL